MMKYILRAEKVSKSFGGLKAVNNVDFQAEYGKITMLIGPNGAGKTTFINLCTGVLQPDSGKIYFNDRDITGFPPHKIYSMGFVRTFQITQPFQTLTVLENVLASMKCKGENPLLAPFRRLWENEEEKNIERAFEILSKVGLAEYWNYEAFRLGGAHLKMLEIARALAVNAKLIALDEPIGGVDPVYAKDILSYVKNLKESEGLSFILIEHRIDIALPYADYVYVMDRGRVIAKGTPDEVANDPKVIKIYIG